MSFLTKLLNRKSYHHDFTVNGLNFVITGLKDVAVASGNYTGVIAIPSKVSNDGQVYAVSAIEKEAFAECTELRGITIPNSILYIGRNAFLGAGKEMDVIFEPSSVDVLRMSASVFKDASIGTLIMGRHFHCAYPPKSYPFSEVALLKEVKIEVPMPSHAFYMCANLKKAVINVESISDFCFTGCTSLNNIVFHDQTKTIGQHAFEQCESLKSLHLPDKLKSMRDRAFSGCTSLVAIDIPSTLDKIGFASFSDCTSLQSIIIPAGVKLIEGYAFEGCHSLSSVIISGSVETLDNGSFLGAGKEMTITFQPSPTPLSIGQEVFKNASIDVLNLSRSCTFPQVDGTYLNPFFDIKRLNAINISPEARTPVQITPKKPMV